MSNITKTTSLNELVAFSQFQSTFTQGILNLYEFFSDYAESGNTNQKYTKNLSSVSDSACELYGHAISYLHLKNLASQSEDSNVLIPNHDKSQNFYELANKHIQLIQDAKFNFIQAISFIDFNDSFYSKILNDLNLMKTFIQDEINFPEISLDYTNGLDENEIIKNLKFKDNLHQISRLLNTNNFLNISIINQNLMAYILDFNTNFALTLQNYPDFNPQNPSRKILDILAAKLSKSLLNYFLANQLLQPQQLILYSYYQSIYKGKDLKLTLKNLNKATNHTNKILLQRRQEDLEKASHLSMFQYYNIDKAVFNYLNN